MSFSSDQFISKLKQLQDTQESISSSSKWLLSQYRDSDSIATTWQRYITQRDLSDRNRLLAVYLVNHVVQQGKSQGIKQFQESFSKILLQTLPIVYSQFPSDLQGKLKRVINIWKQRKVFDKSYLGQIESKLKDIVPKNSDTISINSGKNLSIPPNVQPIIELYQKLKKNKHNIPALKSRFDNAINDLDPNSIVYEGNFNTVTKIAKVTQDTIKESMGNREELIKYLHSLLSEEEKKLEQNRVLLNEIEFALESKDPKRIKNNDGSLENGNNDVLPTYGKNDSDSDSDSDNNSDNDNNSDRNNGTYKKKQNEEFNVINNNDTQIDITIEGSKRVLEEGSSISDSDEPSKKKNKASDEDNEKEYIIEEVQEDDQETTENTITSNIQDLLSRLAN
ncbi:Rtt103p PWA37_003070 [Arxiozyma heterogenica]|uniref:CID domain-containing protein n=1 Tax=Arxiozyma heterogenica TaxID=278026 RepID=A0AAN7WLY9_9SACH|nr:hypothetical protein RI543_004702 [Kazachstania heterogenica]